MCLKFGKLEPSTDVDHIDGNSQNDQRSNYQALCKSHHSEKTATEMAGKVWKPKGGGLDGWPIE